MNTELVNSIILTVSDPFILRGLAFALNILVILFSGKFLRLINTTRNVKAQAQVLRIAAIIFLLLHILDILLTSSVPAYQNYFFRIGLSIAILFGSLVAFNVLSYFSRRKFGEQKEIDGEPVYFDSYNSRLVDIVGSVFIVLIAIYCVIVTWEMDSLLQTTGFIGIVFAFLALTNAIWAPDIYYGLVILNSNMLEDGDLIQIQGFSDEYIINRVSFIHTNLLDVRKNHRVIVRNSQLINSRVDNLSKRASADGLRRELFFNIGYPPVTAKNGAPADKKEGLEGNEFTKLHRQVERMFEQAFAITQSNKESKVNRNLPFEVNLINSGDYALTYRLTYFLEALPSTKVTRTIRQYLSRTPSIIQQAVNQAAVDHGLALATPILLSGQFNQDVLDIREENLRRSLKQNPMAPQVRD